MQSSDLFSTSSDNDSSFIKCSQLNDEGDSCVVKSFLPSANPIHKFPTLTNDDRLFVCRLIAPLNIAQTTTYLDKGKTYYLLITPMAILSTATSDLVFHTLIYLRFPGQITDSNLKTALSNWSLINRRKWIFELDFDQSMMDDSVLDIYQYNSTMINLNWSPALCCDYELQLALKFHANNLQLARYLNLSQLPIDLVVETRNSSCGDVNHQSWLERSHCEVKRGLCLICDFFIF